MKSGRCLCKAVRFAWEGEPNWTLYCHCEDCRRAVSSPVAAWISIPLKNFHFTAGAPAYYASSPGVRRGFCGKCGSPLTYENEKLPGEIHVLAGSLENGSDVKPSAHIVVKEQLPWFEVHDDLPRYEKWRHKSQPVRRGPRAK